MSLILLLLFIFSAYRITRLLQTDDILDRPRHWLRTHLPAFLDAGFTCPWCLGFWISAAVVAIVSQFVDVRLPVIQALATSTGVGLVAEAVSRLEHEPHD